MNPTSNDVIKGRGVPTQNHPGNRYFRQLVADRKPQYALMQKTAEKEAIAIQILKAVQSQTPPGRFLDKRDNGSYYIVDRKVVLVKIKQALREGRGQMIKSSGTKPATSKPSRKALKPPPKTCGNSKRASNTSNSSSKHYTNDDFNRMLDLLVKKDD